MFNYFRSPDDYLVLDKDHEERENVIQNPQDNKIFKEVFHSDNNTS